MYVVIFEIIKFPLILSYDHMNQNIKGVTCDGIIFSYGNTGILY